MPLVRTQVRAAHPAGGVLRPPEPARSTLRQVLAARRPLEHVLPEAGAALPGALACAAVGLTAAANGGYFPTEWGWPTLAFALVVLVAVLVRERIALGRLELVMLVLLAAFMAWTLISVLWSSSATQSVLSTEIRCHDLASRDFEQVLVVFECE